MTLFYKGGCLLPFLIIFNLFFGWLYLSLKAWLISESILIIIFLFYSYVLSRKIISQGGSFVRRANVIDTEGEVIGDDDKPKIV